MSAHRLLPALALAASMVPGLAAAQTKIDDFQLGGSAQILSEECIRLTQDQPYLRGSAWFKNPIDLKLPFEIRMSMVLGKKDLDGADGIVFVFHPTMQTGFRGEGMGFAGLVPSIGIEFDTYQNYHLNDPVADHLAVMTNGNSFHRGDGFGVLELGNLEDGERHPLRITWDPERGRLEIYLDEKLVRTYSAELVRQTFGPTTTVYWGMTAGTGRLSNVQDVCIEKLFVGV